MLLWLKIDTNKFLSYESLFSSFFQRKYETHVYLPPILDVDFVEVFTGIIQFIGAYDCNVTVLTRSNVFYDINGFLLINLYRRGASSNSSTYGIRRIERAQTSTNDILARPCQRRSG